MPVDTSFATVWNALQCALPAMNAASNSVYASFPVQVISGTQQVRWCCILCMCVCSGIAWCVWCCSASWRVDVRLHATMKDRRCE